MKSDANSTEDACPACGDAYDAGNPPGQLPCLHPACMRCVRRRDDGAVRHCAFMVEGVYCSAPYSRAQMLAAPVRPRATTAAAATDAVPDAPDATCAMCVRRPATHVCVTAGCGALFCARDADVHVDLPATAGHEVALRVAPAAAPAPLFCVSHGTRDATLFCQTCDQLACGECVRAPHYAHPMIPVEDGLQRQTARIADTAALVAPKLAVCDEGIHTVRAELDHLAAHRAASLARVDQYFAGIFEPLRALLASVEARRADLETQLAATLDADAKTLQGQCDQLHLSRDHIATALAAVKALAEAPPLADPNHTLRAQSLIAARLATLQATEVSTVPVLGAVAHFYHETAPTLTNLTTTDVASLGAVVQRARRPREYKLTPSLPALRVGAGSGTFERPVSVAVDGKGQLVVGDGDQKRVQILKAQGEFVRSIKTESSAQGVALTATGDVWVCLPNDGRLQLYHGVTGAPMRSVACERPYAVALADDGSLVVGCRRAKGVVMISADGSQKWESDVHGFAQQLVDGVVIVPGEDAVVATDLGNHCLKVLRLSTGKCVRSIGGAGRMNSPCSVAYDAEAHVLLVGEADKISAWTVAGEPVHRWGQGVVATAAGVAVSALDRTVVVVDKHNHRLLVF